MSFLLGFFGHAGEQRRRDDQAVRFDTAETDGAAAGTGGREAELAVGLPMTTYRNNNSFWYLLGLVGCRSKGRWPFWVNVYLLTGRYHKNNI